MDKSEAELLKDAIAAEGEPKKWRTTIKQTPQEACDYVNLPDAQGAGEAVFNFRSDGSVQIYYYL